jgi:hypothetical protein
MCLRKVNDAFIPLQFSIPMQQKRIQSLQHYKGEKLIFQTRFYIDNYEWDRVFANGFSPPDLQILGSSPTVDDQGQSDVSNTTYYIASSGAMVFATGSTYWTSALDGFRFYQNPSCTGQENVVPEMQHLMVNVMSALVTYHTKQFLSEKSARRADFSERNCFV